MKPSTIDFAPRSLRRAVFHTKPLVWLFVVLGALLCGSAAVRERALLAQRDILVDKVQRANGLLAAREAAKAVPKKSAVSDAQAAAINVAVAQLNLPWRELLDAIEQATPKTIALISVEPDARKFYVKGIAECKSSDEMIAYVERLKRQPFFTVVFLTKHEVNERDTNKPLRFQFEAYWRENQQ